MRLWRVLWGPLPLVAHVEQRGRAGFLPHLFEMWGTHMGGASAATLFLGLRETHYAHGEARQDLLHRDAGEGCTGVSGFLSAGVGWTIRTRGDGAIAFDDTTGEVSGAFALGRPPAARPGLMVYIMVDSVADAMKKVAANGGEIVQPIGGDPGEITARFRDPGGNVIGLYQEPA